MNVQLRLFLTFLFTSVLLSNIGFAQKESLIKRFNPPTSKLDLVEPQRLQSTSSDQGSGVTYSIGNSGIDEEPIVGGTGVDISERPWQVALIAKSNGFQFCGGTIIDENWIVSANHCINGATADAVQIFAGSTDKTDFAGGQLIDVDEIIMYPGFDNVGGGYDLALLHLAEPLDLSGPNAQKVGYVTKIDEANGLIDPGVIATVSGWGTLESNGSASDVLMSVDVPIVSNETANSLDYDGKITETMLAAGDIVNGGSDACQGDSGGPLVVPNASGSGYLLAGVTSWGNGCGVASAPGIYARVPYFADWIAETTGVLNNQYPGLIISEIVEGDEMGEDLPKYVEIFNASKESYNLDSVAIEIYTDANHESPITIALSGVLAPESTYIISKLEFDPSMAVFFPGASADLIDGTLDFDGNDVIRLVAANEGYTIDQYGVTDADVTGAFFWSYENSIAIRKPFVRKSNSGGFLENTFAEWELKSYLLFDITPGTHTSALPANDVTLNSIANISNGKEFITCGTGYTVTPEVSIKNSGSSEITSLKLSFTSNVGDSIMTYDLTGSPLAVGAVSTISGPEVDFGASGAYSFSVEVVSVNGGTDGNPINSAALEVGFSLTKGYPVTFSMIFDDESVENTFFIYDENMENVIYEGNGGEFFNGYASGETYEEIMCLPEGFYNFVFYDLEAGFFGYDAGEGLHDPGVATLTINSGTNGDVEVVEVSGLFSGGILTYGFKLPYESVTDASVEIVNPVTGDYRMRCDAAQPVTVEVKNVNSIAINQFSLSYGLTGATTLTYDYSGKPLLSGESATITLDDIPFAEGVNSFEVNIASINGGADDNAANNSSTESVEIIIPDTPETLTLGITPDDYPTEVSWELLDDSGKLIAQGTLTKESANILQEETLCLVEGTYTIRLLDGHGDGGAMAVATDADGNIIFRIGPNYKTEIEQEFSLPFVPRVDGSIQLASPESGNSYTFCSTLSNVPAKVQFVNKGNVPVTGFELTYGFGNLNQTYTFDTEEVGVAIQVGQLANVFLEVPVAVGSDSLKFELVSVNGASDADESNDFAGANIEVAIDNSLNSLHAEYTTDNYPDEFSYEIIDASENVVASSAGLSEFYTTIKQEFCLADGSYIFKFHDDYGDGGTAVKLTNGHSGVLFDEVSSSGYTTDGQIPFCFGCGEVKVPLNPLAEATDSGVLLTWTDNSDNEEGFNIERSLDKASWNSLGTVNPDVVSYLDAAVTAGTTYYYRLEAFKGDTVSGYSTIAEATAIAIKVGIATPGSLTAEATSAKVTLSWEDNSDNEEGFGIERSLDKATWEVIDTVAANTTTAVDNTVTSATTYFYRVSAFSGGDSSDYSNVVEVKTGVVLGLGNEFEIGMYPNPVERGSVLTVKLPNKATVSSVVVVDVTGRSQSVDTKITQNSLLIDTGAIPANIYQLIIKYKSGDISFGKFVIK
ncbi:trypsin-like serine protease [Fulvivirga sp. 29W222]|uniref:Trypsin-like serine protease n=1 Tax=Fulvivirga marina TaxID=2494733 RepID=A0A937FX51_9BACT|nr:trypsin-like serine protease [Fulvivirga marina]MBL6447674.1 trypsin-like serine protease [Fulvivirga marina]